MNKNHWAQFQHNFVFIFGSLNLQKAFQKNNQISLKRTN